MAQTFTPRAGRVPLWAANTPYAAGISVLVPDGSIATRASAGTSRSSYDDTEDLLWFRVAAKYDGAPLDIRRFGIKDSQIDPSAAVDIGAKLNGAFALGNASFYIPKGRFMFGGTGPLILAPNTSIVCHPQAEFYLADGARCRLITTNGSLSDNGRIRWEGGIVNGNDANQGVEANDGNNFDLSKGFRIVKASYMELRNVTVKQIRGHAINHWNNTFSWVRDVRIEQGHSVVQPEGGRRRDGFTGHSQYILVDGLTGYSGDDMMAVNAGAGWSGSDTTPQSVESVSARRIRLEKDAGYPTWAGVSLYVQRGCYIKDAIIDGVQGDSGVAHVRIECYKDAADDVSVRTGLYANVQASNITGRTLRSESHFIHTRFAQMQNFTVHNVQRTIDNGAYFTDTLYFDACTIDSFAASNVMVDDLIAGTDHTTVLGRETGGTAIKSASLTNPVLRKRNFPASVLSSFWQKNSIDTTTETHLSIVGAAGTTALTTPNTYATGGTKVVPTALGIRSTAAQMTARAGAIFTDVALGPMVCSVDGVWRQLGGSAINAAYALMSPDAATAEECVARPLVTGTTYSWASGEMKLTYFVAQNTATWGKAETQVAGTGAAATPTLCRIGIFSVATDGTLTLIGSTPNDTAMWANPYTTYQKALSANVSLTAGQLYAVGELIVSAGARPIMYAGTTNVNPSTQARSPRLCGAVTGLSDLPSTVAPESIVNGNQRPYAALVA